jgi:hypothetical protein
MASTLDPDQFPLDDKRRPSTPGHDVKSLGPSDSSDSGSDLAGPGVTEVDLLNLDRGTNQDTETGRQNSADSGPSIGDLGMDSDSDRFGTGEHLTAGKEPGIRTNADRGFDRVVGPEEAGLGDGLDQAEEAQLGLTDEEIERSTRSKDDRVSRPRR